MKQALHCHHCNTILGEVDLMKLKHVEILCPECGEWSTFDDDPDAYVFKTLEGDD